MKGIQFVVDDTGRRTAVIIDLEKWGEIWEDIYDILVSESRRKECWCTMAMVISVERAGYNLKDLLERLRLGETVTLVGPDGVPLAILVSLRSAPAESKPVPDWEARWDALAEKVSQAWKSEKSATEILAEMRR